MQTELVEESAIGCIISPSRLVLPVLLDCHGYKRVPVLDIYVCVVKGTLNSLLKMIARYLCEIEEAALNKIRASFKLWGSTVGVEINPCKIQINWAKLNF